MTTPPPGFCKECGQSLAWQPENGNHALTERPATRIGDASPSRIEDDEWWLRGLSEWKRSGTDIASKTGIS